MNDTPYTEALKTEWLETQGWRPTGSHWGNYVPTFWKTGEDTKMITELPDPPYPDHTPPAAPEGMRWEYRGMGWRATGGTYYHLNSLGNAGKHYSCSGADGVHYFEAMPILADSGFVFGETTLKEVVGTTPPHSGDPKGEAAAHKAPLHLLPSFPLHETAHVLRSGANKYGEFNWRQNRVKASVYRSAMQRHLDQWFDGLEDADHESSRSHLAHVIASACIVMDAAKQGTLIDDRPSKP